MKRESVLDSYLRDVRTLGFHDDPVQREVASALDQVLSELRRPQPGGLLARWRARPEPVRGLYLYGGVGRGKTYLMDKFFERVPGKHKLRQHFHRFMQYAHAQLATLKDQPEPLDTVARRIADQANVICFDEFFVSDIADAMLLGRLFDRLFALGVTLVATSNVAPDDLYRDGLQRRRFLPAIELIQLHCRVLFVAGEEDYRLQVLRAADAYLHPWDNETRQRFERYFQDIAPEKGTRGTALRIHGRDIATVRRADGVAWFDFAAVCDGPRGTDDYIEIARCFQTVLVSAIPLLTPELENQARRFIALIDEFYERKVKLLLGAEVALAELYQGRRVAFEFERTRSRIEEMHGDRYLALPHLP